MGDGGDRQWRNLTEDERRAACGVAVRWVVALVDAAGLDRASLVRRLDHPGEAIKLFATLDRQARIRRIEPLDGDAAIWWWEIRDAGPTAARAEMMAGFNRAYFTGPWQQEQRAAG